MSVSIPRLSRLAARNPGPMTGIGNWTYLIAGGAPTLIDAGVGAPEHIDELSSTLNASNASLSRVVVTHAHTDHASGAAALATRWPAADFLKYPWPELDSAYAVHWQRMSDGQRLVAGDTTLDVVHTPGHSPDHVCLWHAESRTVLSGDLLVEGATVVIPGSRGGDLIAYLQSLARIEALAPVVALPAHGAIIEDPLALIARYRVHRASREAQILEALDSGADSVAAITAAVYAEIATVLLPVAEETVRAHLAKLRKEGRVSEYDGRLMVRR
jgi:glyoxylase-like metal-dependent hydrolase (beta-lactamase superfamily II)